MRRVERRTFSAADGATSSARPAALPVVSPSSTWPPSRGVVAVDAVLPAVGQSAVEADRGARQRARRGGGDVGHRLNLAGEHCEPGSSARARRPRPSTPGPATLLDRELAQHVGREPVAQVPDRRGLDAARAHVAALLRQRDRDRRDLLRRGLVPQPLQWRARIRACTRSGRRRRRAPTRGRTSRRSPCASRASEVSPRL